MIECVGQQNIFTAQCNTSKMWSTFILLNCNKLFNKTGAIGLSTIRWSSYNVYICFNKNWVCFKVLTESISNKKVQKIIKYKVVSEKMKDNKIVENEKFS